MSRPAFPPGIALAVGILAVSWGSILVRFCEAPSLVIAFYRLGFATLLLLPILAVRRHRAMTKSSGRTLWLGVGSGFLLALHFAAWISSLALTSVASSVVLVSTQPIFSALLSGKVLGERAPRGLYLGIAACLAGTVLISGGDLALSPTRLRGDLLALAGSVAAAGYFVIGRRVRSELPFLDYLLLVYGSAALCLGILAVAAGDPLVGQRRSDYFWFLVMALGPSLIGHGCFNWAVRHLKVYHVNLAAFGEPFLATLYAFLLFGERVRPSLWLGGGLVLTGILLALPRRGAAVPVN